MRPTRLFATLGAIVACGATACSGGGSSAPHMPALLPATSAPARPEAGAVTFTLVVPKTIAAASHARRRPTYVSAGTMSASVTTTTSTAGATPPPVTVLNCSSGQTCSTQILAPAGSDTFSIVLTDGQNGVGNALSRAVSPATTIVSGQANALSVTLNGVVDHVALALGRPSLPAGSAAHDTLTVNAYDAAGDLIMTPGVYVDRDGNPETISLASVDTVAGGAGATTFSPAPVTAPGANFDIAYNGKAMYATTFSTAVSSPIAGSLGTATLAFVPTIVAEYPSSTSAAPVALGSPTAIANGPAADGALWFTERRTSKIGRITTSGAITEFATTLPNRQPTGIALGPDGALWFTEDAGNAIGRITTGGTVLEIPLTTANASPQYITAGPDGNLWFTENVGNKIGKITTSGVVTEYALPNAMSYPAGITSNSDGNLWFTEQGISKIASITTAGTIVEYPLPPSTSSPEEIVADDGGMLWFADLEPSVGSVTTSGTFSDYPLADTSAHPVGIARGLDGNFWFTEFDPGVTIGRTIPTGSTATYAAPGSVTTYTTQTPSTNAYPQGIASGPDGNLWFAETRGGKIGELVY